MGCSGGPAAGDAASFCSFGRTVEAAVASADAAGPTAATAAAAEAETEAAECSADGEQRQLAVEVVAKTERHLRSE